MVIRTINSSVFLRLNFSQKSHNLKNYHLIYSKLQLIMCNHERMRSINRMNAEYEERPTGDCCKVPIPAMFVNSLDENQKKQLYKGPVPHWRWMRDPKGKIEYRLLKAWYPDYDYYSKRFSEGLNLRQENNFGRSEDATLQLLGYGPKDI